MDKLFKYKIEDEEVCITKYVGSSKVVIPEKIEGFPVTSVGEYAFSNNKLEAIILPEKFRARTKEIFEFDEEELDNRNRKYIKKYVDKMRELYMRKLYKNSRKYGLIFEYIIYYTYREIYDGMLEEAIKNIDCSVVCF